MKNVLDNLDSLNKVLSANFLNKKYPLAVTYITTYSCNFKCKYCDIWNYPKTNELTTEQALNMIDEFGGMGTKRFSFNGGEPLLRKDLRDLIKKTKEYGMISTIFSNGSLVKKRIEDIKDVNVLIISFDGPREIQDKQRMNGAYDGVIEAIKTAKEYGMEVWTNTVLTKDNLDHVDFILDTAKRLEFKTIFQPVLHYPHSSKENNIKKLSPLTQKYHQVIEKLKEEKKKNKSIIHSIKYLDYISVPSWDINKRKCWAGKLYCTVTPDGRVAPCYPIFNLKNWPSGIEMGFKKAFKSIPKFSCEGCYCFTVENDFFYSLDLGVIHNTLKNMLGPLY